MTYGYFRLNVKFRLFCIFCITGTKQAERALWRSSRSTIPSSEPTGSDTACLFCGTWKTKFNQ